MCEFRERGWEEMEARMFPFFTGLRGMEGWSWASQVIWLPEGMAAGP